MAYLVDVAGCASHHTAKRGPEKVTPVYDLDVA